MNDKDLTEFNERILFILGVALPFIVDAKCNNEDPEAVKKQILQAVENVIYKNESMPEFPK